MNVYIDRPDRTDLYDEAHELPPIQCVSCGNIDEMQCYDCLGAEGDNLFCNQCGSELRPVEDA